MSWQNLSIVILVLKNLSELIWRKKLADFVILCEFCENFLTTKEFGSMQRKYMQNDLSNYQLIEGSGRKKLADFVILCEFCDENFQTTKEFDSMQRNYMQNDLSNYQLIEGSGRKKLADFVNSVMKTSKQLKSLEACRGTTCKMMIFPTNSSLLKKEFGSSCNFCDESFWTRKSF